MSSNKDSYSLRVFNKEHVETNTILGKTYTVLYREGNYKLFIEAFRGFFEKPHVCDSDDSDCNNCYAIVIGIDLGSRPLFYTGNGAYIVSSNGSTYSNLTKTNSKIDTPPTEMQYCLSGLDKGCTESLDPETMSAWDLVKERLIKTRSDLK